MVNKKIYYVCLVHLLVLQRQALYFIIYLICENTIQVLQNQEVIYKILFYIFFSGLFFFQNSNSN